MIRAAFLVASIVGFGSEASATLSSTTQPVPNGRSPEWQAVKPVPTREASAVASSSPSGTCEITEQTEVKLDDRACKYNEVPASATITMLELAPDRRTVVKIHFKSGK